MIRHRHHKANLHLDFLRLLISRLNRREISTRQVGLALDVIALAQRNQANVISLTPYQLGQWIVSSDPRKHVDPSLGVMLHSVQSKKHVHFKIDDDLLGNVTPYVQLPLGVPIGSASILAKYLMVWDHLRSPSWRGRLSEPPAEAVQKHIRSLIEQTPSSDYGREWRQYLQRGLGGMLNVQANSGDNHV